MNFNPIKGRLGNHRFHAMLVHFPAGLYPFSFVADLLSIITVNAEYSIAGKYALFGAVAMSIPSMIYGMIDFLQIDPKSKVWTKAGIHALLNLTWLVIFASLLFYRLKTVGTNPGWPYLTLMGSAVFGMIYSNYLGADLIISHKIGIDSTSGSDKEKNIDIE